MNFGNGALFVGTRDQESLLAGGEIGRACFPARLAWKRHRGRTDLSVGPARIAGGAASIALDSTRGENVAEAPWEPGTGSVMVIDRRRSRGGAASWRLAARATSFYVMLTLSKPPDWVQTTATNQRRSRKLQPMENN